MHVYSRTNLVIDFVTPLEPKVIPLSNNSNSTRVCGDSLEKGSSSCDSLEAFLPNVTGEVNRINVPMTILVLTEEEIQVIQRVRESVDDFIQLSLRTVILKPNDAGVKSHVEYRGKTDVVSWPTSGEYSNVENFT